MTNINALSWNIDAKQAPQYLGIILPHLILDLSDIMLKDRRSVGDFRWCWVERDDQRSTQMYWIHTGRYMLVHSLESSVCIFFFQAWTSHCYKWNIELIMENSDVYSCIEWLGSLVRICLISTLCSTLYTCLCGHGFSPPAQTGYHASLARHGISCFNSCFHANYIGRWYFQC